jgi:hypothetical protein
MYARSMAMLSLLLATALVVRSESARRPLATLAVHLKPNETVSSAALFEMKSEVEALMASAGFHIEWLDSRDQGAAATTADKLVVVSFRGNCSAFVETAAPQANLRALASSSVVDGHILPFAWVDCSALSRFLTSSLANTSRAGRDGAFGRAMARLLAHEFYHVLAQTTDHTAAGITKPSLSVADLEAVQFTFDSIALARINSRAAVAPQLTAHQVVFPAGLFPFYGQ